MNPSLSTLREKANKLPLSPGVYLMKDKLGKIIYVGKSKALKNRVSQYFQESAHHNLKTQKMVSFVSDFDYMLTDTEMEALTLENKLIKLHQPKFNISLKDGKSYPYLKLSLDHDFPKLKMVRQRTKDHAQYFGPYSGTSTAFALIQTVERIFHLPSCKHQFPRDIGKVRPCIYAQMKQCIAPCTGNISPQEGRALFAEISVFLKGSYRKTEALLKEKMEFAAENLMFEAAAQYRDRIAALNRLQQRQKIVASPDINQDVFALYADELCACLCRYSVREGCVIDSQNHIFTADHIIDSDSLCAFFSDYYARCEQIPSEILFGFPLDEDAFSLLTSYLSERAGHRVYLKFPEKGASRALCDMVHKDAVQHALHHHAKAEQDNEVLIRLASLLALEVVPERIESYDISNFGNDNITAGMVVMQNGKFSKKDYRVFSMKTVQEQDDYASMREAIERRLQHTELPYPDLFLLDGGKGHVCVIRDLLLEKGIDIPVFGMVKDAYHKTRTLVSVEDEISIAKDQGIFSLIYRLQEEVHRFTITKMKQAKQKQLKSYSLTDIVGIGPAKAKKILLQIASLEDLKSATQAELENLQGISKKDAQAIYAHFHPKTKIMTDKTE